MPANYQEWILSSLPGWAGLGWPEWLAEWVTGLQGVAFVDACKEKEKPLRQQGKGREGKKFRESGRPPFSQLVHAFVA